MKYNFEKNFHFSMYHFRASSNLLNNIAMMWFKSSPIISRRHNSKHLFYRMLFSKSSFSVVCTRAETTFVMYKSNSLKLGKGLGRHHVCMWPDVQWFYISFRDTHLLLANAFGKFKFLNSGFTLTSKLLEVMLILAKLNPQNILIRRYKFIFIIYNVQSKPKNKKDRKNVA